VVTISATAAVAATAKPGSAPVETAKVIQGQSDMKFLGSIIEKEAASKGLAPITEQNMTDVFASVTQDWDVGGKIANRVEQMKWHTEVAYLRKRNCQRRRNRNQST
jgi:hypothetical protein